MEELKFRKATKVGKLTYREVNTNVSVLDTSLHIQKRTKRLFRSEKIEERDFNTADIMSARLRTVFDFWDTLYGIIFALLCIVDFFFIIVAALCIWSGYGKAIELDIRTGEDYSIPLDAKTEDVYTLLSAINGTNHIAV